MPEFNQNQKERFELRSKWGASDADTRLSVRIAARIPPPPPSCLPGLFPQYPTRHGLRFRLRVIRHTGWCPSRWPRKSGTKHGFFVFLQALCPWGVHPRPPARLSQWANFPIALERATLQIVRIFHSYLVSGLTQPVLYI